MPGNYIYQFSTAVSETIKINLELGSMLTELWSDPELIPFPKACSCLAAVKVTLI